VDQHDGVAQSFGFTWCATDIKKTPTHAESNPFTGEYGVHWCVAWHEILTSFLFFIGFSPAGGILLRTHPKTTSHSSTKFQLFNNSSFFFWKAPLHLVY
jgi:hypothetical protein